MRIELKGRNVPVSDDVREYVVKRFAKVERQVSELAVLEVEIHKERNPSNPERHVAEATLYLKGITLRAREADRDLKRAIHLMEEELSRQVKRHRDKRRARRESRSAVSREGIQPAL